MQIKTSSFAELNGTPIICYHLIAANNFQIDILNYGGIIHAIWLPDKDGQRSNIVMNYPTLDGYLKNNYYLGAITGRHAGRIGNGQFQLNGTTYNLAKNNYMNSLHGGINGLDKKIWQVSMLENGLELNYTSSHLEEGFPGEVKFKVKYRIIKDYALQIDYSAVTTTDTIVNLTNHSYFNLAGIGNNALKQKLQINANNYCLIDSYGLVTGEIAAVNNTPFDFRQTKIIDEHIYCKDPQLLLANGYDHPFGLNKNNLPAATLIDLKSKRKMDVYTSEEFMVFYSGNFLNPPNLGICLETQNIPNAINLEWTKNKSIVSPDNPYSTYTRWEFSIQE